MVIDRHWVGVEGEVAVTRQQAALLTLVLAFLEVTLIGQVGMWEFRE